MSVIAVRKETQTRKVAKSATSNHRPRSYGAFAQHFVVPRLDDEVDDSWPRTVPFRRR